MSKEVREDTYAWLFAANVYVVVVGVFLIAAGTDIYRAVKSIAIIYGGAV